MKRLLVVMSCIFLSGCAGLQIATPKPVILEGDKMYNVPVGKTVQLERDGKAVDATFSKPMMVVSPNTISEYERKENAQALKQAKIDAKNTQTRGIIGNIFMVLGGLGAGFGASKMSGVISTIKGIFNKGGIKA